MKLLSRSPSETEAIGFRLGKLLIPGDMVKLYGDLGAGKTTMTKGIASAFGVDKNNVISPSFTIITEYESSPPIFHIDLYRISGGQDLESIGIRDCIRNDAISLIEWPEHGGDELPDQGIIVKIEHAGDEYREITVEGIDEKNWNNL